jgi:hypothetical protein
VGLSTYQKNKKGGFECGYCHVNTKIVDDWKLEVVVIFGSASKSVGNLNYVDLLSLKIWWS